MIIRIDDYPTGIRPILPRHITELNRVLSEFEKAKIHYYLGIVPALCQKEDWRYLNSLKYMIPACHGYDHLYFKYHKTLIENNDWYNKAGIGGGDNEFKDLNYKQTFKKTTDSIKILRENLNRAVYTFIPPFNRINKYLEDTLISNKITLVLGEIPSFKRIYTISSGKFYGRTNEPILQDFKNARCITLHTTWEWDIIYKGNSLKEFINLIKGSI
jgi:hypothetical protein